VACHCPKTPKNKPSGWDLFFFGGIRLGGCKPAGKLLIQKNIASNKKQTIVVDNHFDNPLSPSQPPQTCGFVASVSP
jgi:hypothetical protein